jgi:hypothetical protein
MDALHRGCAVGIDLWRGGDRATGVADGQARDGRDGGGWGMEGWKDGSIGGMQGWIFLERVAHVDVLGAGKVRSRVEEVGVYCTEVQVGNVCHRFSCPVFLSQLVHVRRG